MYEKLLIGDPSAGPASFTVFILPFAYAPQRWDADSGPWPAAYHCQGPAQNADDPRRWGGVTLTERFHYLTHESADALFRAPLRAQLGNINGQAITGCQGFTTNGRTHIANLDAPELILFDWSTRDDPADDVLRLGLLQLRAWFPNHAAAAKAGAERQQHIELADLCNFNERYRYLRAPYADHQAHELSPFFGNLPQCFWTNGSVSQCNTSDLYLDRWLCWLNHPFVDRNGNPWRLFPQTWTENTYRWARHQEPSRPGPLIHADSRLYVWTCAICPDKPKPSAAQPAESLSDFEQRVCTPEWVALLNVDKRWPGASTASLFERHWAQQRSYLRWAHDGTLYGFSNHSGAMLILGDALKNPPTWAHFGQIYLDHALLLLHLRAALFRFSEQLATDSRNLRHEGTAKLRERLEYLDLAFAELTNRYQYPLFSTHQQALEIYEYLRRGLDIDQLYVEIRDEVQSSHRAMDLQRNSSLQQQANRIAGAALLFAIGALMPPLWDHSGLIWKWLGPTANHDPLARPTVDYVWFLLLVLACAAVWISWRRRR